MRADGLGGVMDGMVETGEVGIGEGPMGEAVEDGGGSRWVTILCI